MQGSQYTNWDAGLWQIAASGIDYDVVIVLTDGDPTRYGRPTAVALPGGTGVTTRFLDVENGAFSANAMKATTDDLLPHPALLAVGINVSGAGSTANLRAISGPSEYYTTDFASLGDVLDGLAHEQCLGSISVVKQVVPHGGTIGEAAGGGAGWEFTSTNPAETKTTDGSSAVSFETGASTTPTTITETEREHYLPLPQYTRCVNLVTGDEWPVTGVAARTFTVAPDPDGIISCTVYNEGPVPRISIVKSAYPAQFGAVGEEITYTYHVTNTGLVPLHDITVTDDRIAVPIVCEDTTLDPGQSTVCRAVHTITGEDLAIGHVTNTATVTGDPPVGPPVTDDDDETVEDHVGPGTSIEKTAFPDEYAVPGELITYSYHVVNIGTATLHDVVVTDSRGLPVSCPHTTLAPGESMTCHATHITTAADVAAGHIENAGTATGHPPAGPPVTDDDTEIVREIHGPGIEIQKIASAGTFSAAGQAITFRYTVVNVGSRTLHNVSVTDSRIGRLSCPATALAPGETMVCHGTYVTTAADVAAGAATNVTVATGYPPTGQPVSGRDEAILLRLPLVPVTG